MRTHSQILASVGASRIAEVLPVLSIHTVRSWQQRDSIPAAHWRAIVEAGFSSLDELAVAAASRSQAENVVPQSEKVAA